MPKQGVVYLLVPDFVSRSVSPYFGVSIQAKTVQSLLQQLHPVACWFLGGLIIIIIIIMTINSYSKPSKHKREESGDREL